MLYLQIYFLKVNAKKPTNIQTQNKNKAKKTGKKKQNKKKLTLYSFYLQLENIDIYRICQVGIKKNSHF